MIWTRDVQTQVNKSLNASQNPRKTDSSTQANAIIQTNSSTQANAIIQANTSPQANVKSIEL